MGKTLAEKIIGEHAGHEVSAEDYVVVDVDWAYVQDGTGPLAVRQIAKMGIVQVIEGRRVFEHLTVEQNLKVGAHMRKFGRSVKDGLEMVYHYFPRLKQKRNEIAGFISGGEQQMTVVGVVLAAALA